MKEERKNKKKREKKKEGGSNQLTKKELREKALNLRGKTRGEKA